MKRHIFIFILSFLFLLTGCNGAANVEAPAGLTEANNSVNINNHAEYSDNSSNQNANLKEPVNNETSENPLADSPHFVIPEEYIDVLHNNKDFYFAFNHKSTYFKDYLQQFYNGYDIADVKIAAIDFHKDGSQEIIVSVGNTGSIVLHAEKDIVYGYDFSYRAMNTIKSDGSFAWSNSSFNSGWSTIKFKEAEYQYIDILVADADLTTDPPVENWHHNDVKISETEFRNLETEQNNKEDLKLYDFSAN